MRGEHSRERKSKCHGPEVGTDLAHPGNSKEWSELGECGRGPFRLVGRKSDIKDIFNQKSIYIYIS